MHTDVRCIQLILMGILGKNVKGVLCSMEYCQSNLFFIFVAQRRGEGEECKHTHPATNQPLC
jgi:hypothetical protein